MPRHTYRKQNYAARAIFCSLQYLSLLLDKIILMNRLKMNADINTMSLFAQEVRFNKKKTQLPDGSVWYIVMPLWQCSSSKRVERCTTILNQGKNNNTVFNFVTH